MGTMTNNGNWQTDNGVELKVIFYEETKKEDGTYNSDERKYVCLIGATQGAKREPSTSTYGHSTAIGLSPIEVLVPAYFFVTKKSRISWAAIESYKFALEMIDFPKMMKGINDFCTDYCIRNKIKEEPIAVLIVYEAPNNPCSERYSLIEYFNRHGIECKELDYPIQ